MYSDDSVFNRLLRRIALVMFAWTSTFWSQAGLSLFTDLPPYWPVRYTGIPATVAGVHLQDCTSCAVLVAHQAGWVDRGESAGCVGSQLFRGVMCAQCYPFNLPKKGFHSFNPQAGCTLINFITIPGTYSVHTGTYYVQTRYVLSTYHKWCWCAALVQDTVLVVPCTLTALRKITMLLTSIGRRLVKVARVPDWKWRMSVICMSMYQYTAVRTFPQLVPQVRT